MVGFKKKIVSFFAFVVSLVALFGVSQAAHAATLYFSPSAGSYAVGDTFSVGVYVSSTDQAANAMSGLVSFPASTLQVTSISKTGSILSLWVQDPSFSNSAGTAEFEGVVLNPGFTGASGKIATINFKVKAAGNATLTFASGSVLANDGNGTNILSSMGNASFALGGTAPQVQTRPAQVAGLPAAPVIASTTHPDPSKWYSNSSPEFHWQVPQDVTGIRILYDQNPGSTPYVVYDASTTSKKLQDLKDGSYFFHAQFRNASGWGGVSHFEFQIDTENPDRFDIIPIASDDSQNSGLQFQFDAHDATSGIDHYEVHIDNQDPVNWTDDGSHLYTVSGVTPGRHTLAAKAVDKAGNSLANFVDITVENAPAPVITYYRKHLQTGDIFVVKGTTTDPSVDVVLWVQKGNGQPQSWTVQSDEKNNFVFLGDEGLQNGTYHLWATARNAHGTMSQPTEKFTVKVGSPIFLQLGPIAITYFATILFLVLIDIILLVLLVLFWQKFKKTEKKIKVRVSKTNHHF